MTAAIMFAIAFAATVVRPAPDRDADAQDYAEQEERLNRAAAKARRGDK